MGMLYPSYSLLLLSVIQTNSFSIVILSDQSRHASYVVYLYGSMNWNRATELSPNLPTVGYGNGQGQGYQEDVGSDPASYLSGGLLKYRIDQPFLASAEVVVNKGNVATQQKGGGGVVKLQQKGRGNAVLQHLKEKTDLKAIAQELDKGLKQNKESANVAGDAIVQHFENKN